MAFVGVCAYGSRPRAKQMSLAMGSSSSGLLCRSPMSPPRVVPCRTPKTLRVCMQESPTDKMLSEAEERMKKSIESVRSNFNTVRTGRANPAALDRVVVSYWGVDTPLKQLASISTPSSTTIQVEPYDKSCVGDVEKALMVGLRQTKEADLGMQPNSDGSLIRLNVPQLTKERRQEMVKVAKGIAEEGRVALRNIRRDVVDKLKKLEKSSDIGKDESKAQQDDTTKLTNKYVKSIDDFLSDKEKDILTV